MIATMPMPCRSSSNGLFPDMGEVGMILSMMKDVPANSIASFQAVRGALPSRVLKKIPDIHGKSTRKHNASACLTSLSTRFMMRMSE